MCNESRNFEEIYNTLDSVKPYIHVLKIAQKYVTLNKNLLNSYSLAVPYLKISHNIPQKFLHLVTKYSDIYFTDGIDYHIKDDDSDNDANDSDNDANDDFENNRFNGMLDYQLVAEEINLHHQQLKHHMMLSSAIPTEAHNANFDTYYHYNSKTARIFQNGNLNNVNKISVKDFKNNIKKCLDATIDLYRPIFEYYQTPKISREKSLSEIKEKGIPWNKVSKQGNDSQDNFWTSNKSD